MKFITLKNNLGMEVSLCNIGAGLVDIKVPDKNGIIESILAHPKGRAYAYASSYFGKPCGRTAGRIANGIFTIKGVTYLIKKGHEPHALHGGKKGLSYRRFSYRVTENDKEKKVSFYIKSKDMDGGYPGNLYLTISYTLSKTENTLEISYDYFADKDTLCNLTNHAYFNLSGDIKRNVLDEELFINSSKIGFINEILIPSKIIDVPLHFNFKNSHCIGEYIREKDVIQNTNGYDHPYLLDEINYDIPQVVLSDNISGRRMQMFTTYETVVCYSCNYPEAVTLSNGNRLKQNDAICLEMQHFPNGVNSSFISNPLDVMEANEQVTNKIKLVFSTYGHK